jgi:hypothetical protein
MDLTGLTEKQTKGRWKTVYYENESGEIVAKVCRKCNETKDVDDYAKKKSGLGGSISECRLCKSETNRIWRESNKELITGYYYNNIESERERSRNYRRDNKERVRETNQKWYETTRGRQLELKRNWQRNNPDKVTLSKQRRRARKVELPDDFTPEQVTATALYFKGCALTGDSNVHFDHLIPLATGHGGTTYGNMIPLRADLNLSKQNANIFEWFNANKERFNLQQEKFDLLIAWLSAANEMSVDEYKDYVYYCHANPRDVE